jgi:hypothetical protein
MTAQEYQRQLAAVRKDLREAKEAARREGVDAVGFYPITPDPERAEALRAEGQARRRGARAKGSVHSGAWPGRGGVALD